MVVVQIFNGNFRSAEVIDSDVGVEFGFISKVPRKYCGRQWKNLSYHLSFLNPVNMILPETCMARTGDNETHGFSSARGACSHEGGQPLLDGFLSKRPSGWCLLLSA